MNGLEPVLVPFTFSAPVTCTVDPHRSAGRARTWADEWPARAARGHRLGSADGIAVVPFEVRGQGLDIWREGMMDLVTNGLDGVGGFRTIDSRTLIARWNDNIPAGTTADLSLTLKVAEAAGARYAIEGSVVALGPDVRLVANVYEVDAGRESRAARRARE